MTDLRDVPPPPPEKFERAEKFRYDTSIADPAYVSPFPSPHTPHTLHTH